MTRVFLLVTLFLLISIKVTGQCVNPATVTLSVSSGITCDLTQVTVSGNTFGGSATNVTITDNGAGSVSPGSTYTTPFTFRYTPRSGDIGKNVIITVTTNNPPGKSCSSVKATYTLTVNANTLAPLVGTITMPTCSLETGAVVLSRLPSSGTWTLNRNPGGITTSGSGTSTAIAGLATGTYTFTVTSQVGCTSPASSNVIIPAQPASPAVPLYTIDCTAGFDKAVINVTSPNGTGLNYSLDGGMYQSGNSFSNVANGVHWLTVKNLSGCTTRGVSFEVLCGCTKVMNPPAPLVGVITQPTCTASTGSVILSGLPSTGIWTLIRSPGGVTTTGTGINTTIPYLTEGLYTYTVTNSSGCISPSSAGVLITAQPGIPGTPIVGSITAPTCTSSTGSVVLNGLPETSNWILTRYPGTITTVGTGTSITLSYLPAGAYNFTLSNATGCISAISGTVIVPPQPLAPSPPVIGTITQPGYNIPTGSVDLNGLPENGSWTLTCIPGNLITSGTGITKTISGLASGNYRFTVTSSEGCTSALSESFGINMLSGTPEFVVSTLITPNMDGKNDYFVIKGNEPVGRIELVIFNRIGYQIYKNENYDNSWNGINYNGNPLPDDTYFYILKTDNKRFASGYIVIRR